MKSKLTPQVSFLIPILYSCLCYPSIHLMILRLLDSSFIWEIIPVINILRMNTFLCQVLVLFSSICIDVLFCLSYYLLQKICEFYFIWAFNYFIDIRSYLNSLVSSLVKFNLFNCSVYGRSFTSGIIRVNRLWIFSITSTSVCM